MRASFFHLAKKASAGEAFHGCSPFRGHIHYSTAGQNRPRVVQSLGFASVNICSSVIAGVQGLKLQFARMVE
jgi:hypothetical protein